MSEQISVTPAIKTPPPQVKSLEELQRLKAELEIDVLLKQKASLERAAVHDAASDADVASREDARRQMQASTVARLRRKQAQDKTAQETCPHKKENNKTAVVGQRDGHNHYRWVCQNCLHPWLDNELPFHLRPDTELVGGPAY